MRQSFFFYVTVTQFSLGRPDLKTMVFGFQAFHKQKYFNKDI